MIVTIILLIIGLVLVVKGGDLFVEAGVEISEKLGIPRIVIGGTIVSLATTMPELVVSATASFMGDSGIAIGNAVGSAIANIGLIVGIVALMTVVSIDKIDFGIRSTWMFISALLVMIFSWDLYIGRWFGMGLILLALVYLVVDFLKIMRGREIPAKESKESIKAIEEKPDSVKKNVFLFAAGAVMVIVGSHLLVTSGITIAAGLGIPSVVIGLSVIAIGTSLPELVTAVASVRRGVPDLAIGNIVGANVLNLAFIVGISAVIRPLTLTRFTQVYSLPWLMVFVVLMIIAFRHHGQMGKRGGILFLSLYALYIAGLICLPFLQISL